MKVKIDTKEKFNVITLQEPILSANMTEELTQMLLLHLDTDIKNVIVKLGTVSNIDERAAESILELQQKFNEQKVSFVICEMQKGVEGIFEKLELLGFLNVTPTESEAWDIVQMEEIEREFLD